MTDLDKLIAAVEAGSIPRHDLDAFIPWRGLVSLTNDSLDAYYGSLDAAKRLHDALMPGWDVDLELRPLGADIESGLSDVLIYAPYSDGGGIRGCDANPARAWLLAILRAVKAKAAAP